MTEYAQRFVAQLSDMTSVEFSAEVQGSGSALVHLRADNQGKPGIILATAIATLPPSGVPALKVVPLSARLTPGQPYHISIEKDPDPKCIVGLHPSCLGCGGEPLGSTHEWNHGVGLWSQVLDVDLGITVNGDWTDYPTDVELDATDDGDVDWIHAGEIRVVERTLNFANEINDFLATCVAVGGKCTVPLAITTASVGRLRLDNIRITVGTSQRITRDCGPTTNLGICNIGAETCIGNNLWSACEGAVFSEREICNGLDDDCTGVIDNVGGHLTVGDTKCQCFDGLAMPGEFAEICDTIDNDCDATGPSLDNVDEGCTCADMCAYQLGGQPSATCRESTNLNPCLSYETPAGEALDCFGGFPFNRECCCATDPICVDNDLDGFEGEDPVFDCSDAGQFDLDCDDENPLAHPGGTEVCDNVDNDCDGSVDEGISDSCGRGICAGGNHTCVAGEWQACSTASLAIPELCNGLDDDCDGIVDFIYRICDAGGLGICGMGKQVCVNGVWNPCLGFGPAPFEVCNGADDNCDGVTDEGFDFDADGIGDCVDNCPTVYNNGQRDSEGPDRFTEGF